MIFLAALVLLLLFTLLTNATLRTEQKPAFLTGIFLLAFSEIVLAGEIASLFGQINRSVFLLLHALFAGGAWLAWNRTGRPPLLGPFAGSRFSLQNIIQSIQRHPILWVLGLGLGIVYLVSAGLILVVPPNNFDSMTYHLSRVGYWLQHQSLSPWPTPNLRQTTFPINAELGILWTVLFNGTDRLAGFVQWISAIVCGLGIFGTARLIGASRTQSAFAGLIWASFPQVILQSTTTQNDLVAAAFLVSSVYHLFLGMKTTGLRPLLLSGMALGLALGTKSTVVMALPGLGLTIGILWIWERTKHKMIMQWAGLCVFGFLLLGAFGYMQNQITYGNPFTAPQWGGTMVGTNVDRWEYLTGNFSLYLYQSVDFSGLPEQMADSLVEAKALVGESLFNLVRLSVFIPNGTLAEALRLPIDFHEDRTWFGLLSVVVFLPAVIGQTWEGLRKRDAYRLGLILPALIFGLVLSAAFAWTAHKSRYFVLTVTLCAPCIGFFYRPGRFSRWVFPGIITALALLIAGETLLLNQAKPLVGINSIIGKDRISLQTINQVLMDPVVRMVEAFVPPDASMAVSLAEDEWDYPFFGNHFEREIVQIGLSTRYLPVSRVLSENSTDFMLVSPLTREGVIVPEGFIALDSVNDWTLYYQNRNEFSAWDADVRQRILNASEPRHMVTVDPILAGKIGAVLEPVAWEFEEQARRMSLWLGEGAPQGVEGALWAGEEATIRIEFEVAPGPGREDAHRNLEFFFTDAMGNQTVETRTIEGAARLGFILPLQPGENRIRLSDLDHATHFDPTGKDPRPLLALLRKVRVSPLDRFSLVRTAPELGQDAQVEEIHTAPWGIEPNGEDEIVWLGQGEGQGMEVVIRAEEARDVVVEYKVMHGDAREDRDRWVEFTVIGADGQETVEQRQFAGEARLLFSAALQPGLNIIRLSAMDEVTVTRLPGGDTRPLLVVVYEVEIQKK